MFRASLTILRFFGGLVRRICERCRDVARTIQCGLLAVMAVEFLFDCGDSRAIWPCAKASMMSGSSAARGTLERRSKNANLNAALWS